LSLKLGKGRKWLTDLRYKGKGVFHNNSHRLSFVDYLQIADDYCSDFTHPIGTYDPGELEISSIELEEKGPLRASFRLEGYTDSQEPQRIILRLEFLAGSSSIRLFHSVEFLHKDPRKSFVMSMGLALPLSLDQNQLSFTAGAQKGPVHIKGATKAGLRQSSCRHYKIWQDESSEKCREASEENQHSRGWLTCKDDKIGCTAVLRNMWQEAPKEIFFDPEEKSLQLGLWPRSHSLMDVRRYSNHLHSSQGESLARMNRDNWINEYYADEPFVGISKTHECLLIFHEPELPSSQIDAVAADFQSPALIYVSPLWYKDLKVTLPYPLTDDRKYLEMEKTINDLTNFWLYHQKLWEWYGMWDFGDVRHRFSTDPGHGWFVGHKQLEKVKKLSSWKIDNIDFFKTLQLDHSPVKDSENSASQNKETDAMPAAVPLKEHITTLSGS